MQRRKSEIDLAVDILVEKQQPIYCMDLVREVAARMGKRDDPETLTSMYTRFNLDNRLVYQGEGYWYYDTNRPLKDHKE
ncbi:MAG: DNA-directed RNA polymerase subunit delta [Syntrophomonadaceae bacterium]